MERIYRNIMLFLLVLAILVPIGLLLPRYFKAGSAWGEWSKEEVREQLGYIPEGMQDAKEYNPPAADYNLGEQDENGLFYHVKYIASAFIGISIIAVFTGFLYIYYRRHES